jgi:hypothetical protein
VAAHPNDPQVMERAADWLRVNEAHTRYFVLLTAVIARTEGAKEWLDRGEEYIRTPGSSHLNVILGVLLTAGKADPKYIEMAFDFIVGKADKRYRSWIDYNLSRALVRNLDNAEKYLNGTYEEQRKKTVCASIAGGMKRFPDTIAAFALDMVPRLDSGYVYHILRNVITRGLEDDYLDEMIAQWLVDNYRRRGYGGMLDALHKNRAFWKRLLMLRELPKRIRDDFNARNS